MYDDFLCRFDGGVLDFGDLADGVAIDDVVIELLLIVDKGDDGEKDLGSSPGYGSITPSSELESSNILRLTTVLLV